MVESTNGFLFCFGKICSCLQAQGVTLLLEPRVSNSCKIIKLNEIRLLSRRGTTDIPAPIARCGTRNKFGHSAVPSRGHAMAKQERLLVTRTSHDIPFKVYIGSEGSFLVKQSVGCDWIWKLVGMRKG